MKKSDIAMIIFIASISVLVSYLVVKSFFGGIYDGQTIVKTVDRIESNVVEPSEKIFNKDAINPAVQVEISGSESDSNDDPGM